MDVKYATFEQLLAATADVRPNQVPLKVTVWGPDSRFTRLRAVEIHDVGFTQVQRPRFRSWESLAVDAVSNMVVQYIGLKYDVMDIDVWRIPLDIEWIDRTWVENQRGS